MEKDSHDKNGLVWLKKKLEALDRQIVTQIEELEQAKRKRENLYDTIVGLDGHTGDIKSSPLEPLKDSLSEQVVSAVVELVHRTKKSVVTSGEIMDFLEHEKKINFAIGRKAKKTATLSAILAYETKRRKRGRRLVQIARGAYSLNK